jgi:hypothetical protein
LSGARKGGADWTAALRILRPLELFFAIGHFATRHALGYLTETGHTAQHPAYLVSAGRLQASQKKISPNSKRTTLKPIGIASTLKSKARFSVCERRAGPDIPQFEHVSNSVHVSPAVMHADSRASVKLTHGAAVGCSELLTFEIGTLLLIFIDIL